MILFLFGIFGFAEVSAKVLGLQEGADCTPLGGGQGVCKLLSKCGTAGDYKNNHPPICSFIGLSFEPIICCPKKVITESGRKVKKICEELNSLKPEEGRLDLDEPIYILGFQRNTQPTTTDGFGLLDGLKYTGPYYVRSPITIKVLTPKKHPYMALIGYCISNKRKLCDLSEVKWGCGGSLITPWYILSAAHCANVLGYGSAKWAKLGEVDFTSRADDPSSVNMRIVDIIIHPKYNDSQLYHDVVLFQLENEVTFSPYVFPACLQTERLIEQQTAIIVGWGSTANSTDMSSHLLEAEINFYNDTECSKLMFECVGCKNDKLPIGYQSDLMFCAGVPDGSKDTCKGDSGGPLVTRSAKYPKINIQVGITSFGKSECAVKRDSPGVYTRISNYIPWIEEVAFKDVSG